MGTIHSLMNASVEQTDKHCHVAFSHPHRVLSSAVLNGGQVEAEHLLNLNVPKKMEASGPPESTLDSYARENCWSGLCVGMMTAASMDSLRIACEVVEDIELAAIVTAVALVSCSEVMVTTAVSLSPSAAPAGISTRTVKSILPPAASVPTPLGGDTIVVGQR